AVLCLFSALTTHAWLRQRKRQLLRQALFRIHCLGCLPQCALPPAGPSVLASSSRTSVSTSSSGTLSVSFLQQGP
ncbi:hypothetical protein NDU88_011416, partial [Pleurodeles waltl]